MGWWPRGSNASGRNTSWRGEACFLHLNCFTAAAQCSIRVCLPACSLTTLLFRGSSAPRQDRCVCYQHSKEHGKAVLSIPLPTQFPETEKGVGAVSVCFAHCLYSLRWDLAPDLCLPHLGDCSAALLLLCCFLHYVHEIRCVVFYTFVVDFNCNLLFIQVQG